MFITFEGIDGCGKSTQLALLAARLEQAGLKVCTTREPGGTELAEKIRGHLLHSTQPLDGRAELLLFGAARAQHVQQIIRPALERGEYVLSDRFGDSSVAYQSGGLGLSRDFILEMNAFATGGLSPVATYLLDVDPAIATARRASQQEDRIEKRGLEFQTKVRAEYLHLAGQNPGRFVVLDATATPEELHRQIVADLIKRGVAPESAAL